MFVYLCYEKGKFNHHSSNEPQQPSIYAATLNNIVFLPSKLPLQGAIMIMDYHQ